MSISSQIIGWGVDARPEDRPGVPQELAPPRPVGSPSYVIPEQQPGVPTVHGIMRPVTPSFGTAAPLRGLSGIVRRAAYAIPDYKPRRWLLLMVADRIDVLEHNVLPMAAFLGVISVATLGVLGVRAIRRA